MVKTNEPLLVRGLNWLGDAVMSLPALRAIHQIQPERPLTVVTRSGAASIYRGQPGVTEIIIDDRNLKSRLNLISTLRAQTFEGAILFQNAFSAALIAKLAGIPWRLGYTRHGRRFLLSQPVRPTTKDLWSHEAFYYLKLLEAGGISAPFSLPHLTLPELPLELSLSSEFNLALSPGAAYGQAKRWPVDTFAQTANLILKDRPGLAIILGGAGEMDTALELEQKIKGPTLNLAGRTSLEAAMAVLGRANLLLTNDSGLMHMAGALEVPLVSVFGPTNPLTTGPLGRLSLKLRKPFPCSPCLKRECPRSGGRICFDGLTPELVATAANSLLNQPQTTNNIFWLAKNPPPLPDRLIRAGYRVITPNLEEKHTLKAGHGFWISDQIDDLQNRQGRTALVLSDQALLDIPGILSSEHIPDLAVPDEERTVQWLLSLK